MILVQAVLFTISFSLAITYHVELRSNFQNRRKPDKKVKHSENLKLEDKKYINGIEHFKKQELSREDAKMVEDIEKDFRRLVAMRGVKYLYKRDMHWRTWRGVKIKDGVENKVFYKCNNQLLQNSSGCTDCGLWTIEDPPCPLEYYSVVDKDRMCAHNHSMQPDPKNVCPVKIKFLDLPITCDNPMKTEWRFTSEFGTSNYKNIICGGETYCEILTVYLMSPKNITFRMINSTGNIIYSRIMAPNNTNYVCIHECGNYDPHGINDIKFDIPTEIKLLAAKKNKRDLKGMKIASVVDSNVKKNHLSNTAQIIHRRRRETNVTKHLQYLYHLPNISLTTTMSSNVRKKMVYKEYEDYYPDYLIL